MIDPTLLVWLYKQIVGDRRPSAPSKVEDTNAWLGLISAGLGVLSLVFGAGALAAVTDRTIWNHMGRESVVIAAAFGFAIALLAGRCGRRAPAVTTQYLGLARFGVVISSMSSLISAIALALSMLRWSQW